MAGVTELGTSLGLSIMLPLNINHKMKGLVLLTYWICETNLSEIIIKYKNHAKSCKKNVKLFSTAPNLASQSSLDFFTYCDTNSSFSNFVWKYFSFFLIINLLTGKFLFD